MDAAVSIPARVRGKRDGRLGTVVLIVGLVLTAMVFIRVPAVPASQPEMRSVVAMTRSYAWSGGAFFGAASVLLSSRRSPRAQCE